MKRRQALLSFALFSAAAMAPRLVLASPPAADLMSRLADHAAAFEKMKKHSKYVIGGKLETLALDDATDSTKTMKARVSADGDRTHVDVVRYTENGEDKTADARDKVAKREKEREEERARGKEKKRDLRMPFLKSEQSRYVFDQAEVDKVDPSRVRITFVPKEAADDTIEGSAWVDTKAGTVISAGFKLSRTPTFIDHVHFTVEFGATTKLGPAPSHVSVTGKAGLLFFNKRFRGEASFSDYDVGA
ncbi:MAG: hypothetical protein ACRELY_22020 [Polyangiaceae bacterium]